MIKKKIFLFAGLVLMIILGNALISGAVCCEKLKSTGLWCQGVTDKSQCDSKYSFWLYKQDILSSCIDVPDCSGTCINKNTGECSQYTDKRQCTESSGTWDEKDPEEISACHEVCCLLGQDAYFINPTACNAMFTQYGIQGVIRTDITTREDCEALRKNTVVGACVYEENSQKKCLIKTATECDKTEDSEFYSGLLCTASENGKLISSCAPSSNTECKDNKVYFKDLCGNFANIYASSMFSETRDTWTKAMNDYWTFMKDPYYDKSICNVTSSGSNTCGNCDPYDNTVCKNYGETTLSKPQNNANGLVCGDLSCKYKDPDTGITRTYQHGESWCVGTASTFPIIINLTTSEISKSNITALKNASKYNLPGSKYYKLVCSAGEVTVQECGDYRNSVCMEGKNDDSKKKEAFCVFNNWRTCFQIDSKTDCEEDGSLCKWIPGYRWDTQIVSEGDRKERQGSCAPLIAPGFDFWDATSQGNAICAMANVQDAAMFETGIWTKRSSLTGTNADSWPLGELADRCTNDCYTIPGYAKEFNQIVYPNGTIEAKSYPLDMLTAGESLTNYQKLTLFYENIFPLSNPISSYSLSLRKGQYCFKGGDLNRWSTGKVRNNVNLYDCTALSLGKKGHVRDAPIYLTNDEWLNSITERARALGDCGYKMSINGKYDDSATEMITAIFQKLKQNGNVKKNVTVEQIIYKGGAYLKGDLEKYESTLSTAAKTYTCAQNYNGICTTTVNNPTLCEGGTNQAAAEGENLCPDKMACCVYPELS
jgi:hypothetical protein